MERNNNDDVDVRKLIQKLDHPLEEVRVRAFNNLSSKLNNEIITLECLLSYDDLYVHLLHFLNRSELEERVIDLLASLVQFPTGAERLTSIGGIDFFTCYRQRLGICSEDRKEERGAVDKILDCLFYLPNADDVPQTDLKPQDSVVYKTNNEKWNDAQQQKCSEILHRYECVKNISTETYTNHVKETMSSIVTSSILKRNESSITSTQPSVEFSKETFQWLPLTSGDRQILAVTESRLQSSSSQLILQSCDFLRNVLLHDFPAEVFIQRPNIVKTLLHVLSISKSKQVEVSKKILQVLFDLCKRLQQRLFYIQNENVWQKPLLPDDFCSLSISSNTTKSSNLSNIRAAKGQKLTGEHQDTDNSTINNKDSSNKEDDCQMHGERLGDEDIESSIIREALIQSQMSPSQFLMSTLLSSVELLSTYLLDNHLFTLVAMLHKSIIDVLSMLDMKPVWNSACADNKAMIHIGLSILSQLKEVCVVLSDEKYRNDRIMNLKSTIICQIIIYFLQACVPSSRYYEVLSEEIILLVKKKITEFCTMEVLPELQKSLEYVLMNVDEGFIEQYNHSLQILVSLEKIDDFMESEVNFLSDRNWMEVVHSICQSLPYHSHSGFIEKIINMCCKHYNINHKENEQAKQVCSNIIMRQPLEVKRKSYSVILKILKESLSESLVQNPMSTKHQRSLLFVQKDFITEFAFNCNSYDDQLKNLSASIVCLLLTSQLNMSVSLWNEVLTLFIPLLPILQCHLGDSSDQAFDSCILSLIDRPRGIINVLGEMSGLSAIDTVRASVRMLYHQLPKLRSTGFALSLNYLTNYDKEKNQVVNYTKNQYPNPGDVFMFNARDLAGLQLFSTQFESITEQQVEKLWAVFKDDYVDETLRSSAAEQLTVVLQDVTFHAVLTRNSEYKYILEQLSLCLLPKVNATRITPDSINKKHVLFLIKILRLLTYHHPTIRHILSLNKTVYMQLLQIVLLHAEDLEMKYYTSSLLCLLLWDEVYIMEPDVEYPGKQQLKLPEYITRRFRLPLDIKNTSSVEENKGNPLRVQNKEIFGFIKNACWLKYKWYTNVELEYSKLLQSNDQEKEQFQSQNFLNIIQNILQSLNKPYDHFNAIDSLNQMKLGLIIIHKTKRNISNISSLLLDVFKQGFLKQIMSVPPTSIDDHKLFECVISFLNTVMELNLLHVVKSDAEVLMSDVIVKMIVNGQQHHDDGDMFVKYSRVLQQLVVTSISSLCKLLRQKATPDTASRGLHPSAQVPASRVCVIVQAIYRTLSITGPESYYDLPLMEFMLACLMHLLVVVCGWSVHVEGGGGMAFCVGMFNWLTQILVSFHVDRVSAVVSFMGKGIVQKTLICLCHLIHEMNTINSDSDWLKHCALSTGDTSNNTTQLSYVPSSSLLPWLLPLLSDRSIDIRMSGWTISIALLSDQHCGHQIVVNEFQNLPGGIWAASLGVVLDEKECFLVRSQTAMLLCKLIDSKKLNVSTGEQSNLWNSIIVQDTSSKMEVSGLEAFLLLLDHFEFFNELRFIFSQQPQEELQQQFHHHSQNNSTQAPASSTPLINASTSFSHTSTIITASESSTTSTVLGSPSLPMLKSTSNNSKTSRSRSGSNEKSFMTTQTKKKPQVSFAFKKSLLCLVCCLVKLSPKHISKKLSETGLLDSIMSSWVTDDNSTNFKNNTKDTEKVKRRKKFFATTSILQLLDLLLSHDPTKCIELVEEYNILEKLFSLLQNHSDEDEELSNEQHIIWNSCTVIIAQLFEVDDTAVNNKFRDLGVKYLAHASETIKTLLKNARRPASVRTITLLLNLVLLILKDVISAQGEILNDKDQKCYYEVVNKRSNDVANKLSKSNSDVVNKAYKRDCPVKSNLTNLNADDAKNLCSQLLLLYAKNYLMKDSCCVTQSVLQALFVCSLEAKRFALNNGFVETLLEELKDRLVKLKMLSAFESEDDKIKKTVLLEGLCVLVDMMRNFMCECGDIKLAFLQSKLVVHLQHVWGWAQIHEELRTALLSMMTVFAAGCNEACSAFCAVSSLSLKQSLDETSFVNYAIKLLVRYHNEATLVHGKTKPYLKTIFEFLTNVICVAEGRNCVYKANTPYLFIQAHSLTTAGNKNQRSTSKTLVLYWLKLYVVLSFHTDGAKYVSKMQGITGVLLDLITEKSATTSTTKREYAMLILRNLTFVPASKQTFTSNNDVIHTMLKLITEGSLRVKLLAISFFSNILFDNQKGKGILSKLSLNKVLMSLQEEIQSGKTLTLDGDINSYNRLVPLVDKTLMLLKS